MTKCTYPVNISMLLRIILTVGSISYLALHRDWVAGLGAANYLYLILPVLLTLLDLTDNAFKFDGALTDCARGFDYQIKDKLVDLGSYLFSYGVLDLDPVILYLTVWRAVGVGLFYLTRVSAWLVLFFDFVKEYMLYRYVFGQDFSHIPLVLAVKVFFEYYLHTVHLNRKY